MLHQYMSGRYAAGVAGGESLDGSDHRLPMERLGHHPRSRSADRPVELALRVPHSAEQPTLTVNGTAADTAPTDGWWVVSREWNDGDEVVLVLPVRARPTEGAAGARIAVIPPVTPSGSSCPVKINTP